MARPPSALSRLRYHLAAVAGLALLAGCAVAHADPAAVTDPAALPPELQAAAQLALVAVQHSDWRLIAVLALVALVYAVRFVGARWWAWLGTDRGGALLALLGGVAGAVLHSLLAGALPSWQLLLDGMVNGVMAAGGYAVLRKLLLPSDKPPQTQGLPLPPLALLFIASVLLSASACAPAYATVEATARAGSVAITEFKTYDAAHKRELLAAHPECRAASAPAGCYQAVLAPYVAQREPVLASIDALAPALQAAKATAAQADTDRAVTAALAAQLGNLVAQLLNAVATLEGSPR